jgi:hypothetical protein
MSVARDTVRTYPTRIILTVFTSNGATNTISTFPCLSSHTDAVMYFCSMVGTSITDRIKILISDVIICEQGSSVSIVSGYGLDDRTIEVRSPTETKGFFL